LHFLQSHSLTGRELHLKITTQEAGDKNLMK